MFSFYDQIKIEKYVYDDFDHVLQWYGNNTNLLLILINLQGK